MTTQSRLCADCGEIFPAQRDETVCRLCDFGPLLDRLHASVSACAAVLGPPCPCEACDGYGWVPSRGDICGCAVCVGEGWVGSFEAQAFEAAQDVGVIG
jgi:hypothetical protein